MTSANDIQKLVDRFDKAMLSKEDATIKILKQALQQSFDRLELEVRRKYPQMEAEGGLLAAQRNAVILLQQVKGLMQVIDPAQAAKLQQDFQELLQSSSEIGRAFAADAIRAFNSSAPVFLPQIPIEAATYAAQDSAKRLQRHGDEFASKAGAIITQGLIQNWGMSRTIKLMKDSLDLTKAQAETIVRTESMQAMTNAQMATFSENGIQYIARVTAVGDRVCRICAGRAGEILPIDKMIVILHPRCRCVGIAVNPVLVKAGLQPLDWLQEFHEKVSNALPDGVSGDAKKLAPFEKSAGMKERPDPVWTPRHGYTNTKFEKVAKPIN